MFSLQDFIKGGLITAIGDMPNYQIILKSADWFEKGVLTESDLAEIQEAIDSYYAEPETPIEEPEIEEESE